MASGAGLKQIIVTGAAPGTDGCPFSAQQTVTATTGDANTVITDIGLLHFNKTAASVSLQFQDPLNTWTEVLPAGSSAGFVWFSDGTNLRVHSADTSTNRTATYYIIQ